MGERHIVELREVPVDELAPFLTARSGLPGPRGNLELADAFASIADRSTILRFVELDDEYLRFCGTEAVGRLIVEEPDDASHRALIQRRATDNLWRVREGAARALQIVGDADRGRLRTIVAEWVGDANPYVCRAAVAVAADPDAAMPAFERLQAVDDPDIRWIVASNLKKSRLRRHLER